MSNGNLRDVSLHDKDERGAGGAPGRGSQSAPRVSPVSLSPSGKKLGFTLDNGKLHNVSLGQGQEVVAEDTLDLAAEKGHWVILQVRAASGCGHPPPERQRVVGFTVTGSRRHPHRVQLCPTSGWREVWGLGGQRGPSVVRRLGPRRRSSSEHKTRVTKCLPRLGGCTSRPG